MTSSLYSSSYDTFLSFRSTGLLAATPFLGSGKTWRTVTSSFFPHLEFLLNCCYIFQVLGFSLWQLLSFWIYPGSKVQISILRITQTYLRILLSSHEEQSLGEPECQLPLRLTSVANFIALLSILKSFFSPTFKHRSPIIMSFSQFCCFNMGFMLWELHTPTF